MLNESILQGRLTQDPELKTTPNGKSVTSFSLAVERDYSTDNEKTTDFINIVAWNNTAEFITKYFNKGKQMIVKGSIQTRKYQTQNGEKRTVTEVLADRVYFAGDKEKASQSENYGTNDINSGDTGDFVAIDGDEDLPF